MQNNSSEQQQGNSARARSLQDVLMHLSVNDRTNYSAQPQRPGTRNGRIPRPLQIYSEDFGWVRGEEMNTYTQPVAPVMTTNRGTSTQLVRVASPNTAVNSSPSPLPPVQRPVVNSTYTRPQFRSKVVCMLDCKYCGQSVCKRGMKAILLADMAVELFSTDLPPESRLKVTVGVEIVNDDYQAKNCFCRIRDVACKLWLVFINSSGNVIGYHVTQPCSPCMEACNNGHFWMFNVDHVNSFDRTAPEGGKPLVWANLARPDMEQSSDNYDIKCR